MPPRYILIANPGTKRCETYCSELLNFWSVRGEVPDVEIVPWADVVPRDGNLDGLSAFDRSAIVRLESPGKNDWVTRFLLEAGDREDSAQPSRVWRSIEFSRGLLVRPGLVYRGFHRVLRGLRNSFDLRPHLTPTACPLDVAEMFDKTAAAIKVAEAGVPVPEMIQEPPDMPEVIHDLTIVYGWPTAYVKLNTGSSAAGIVVLHPNSTDRPAFGITTLAQIDGAFFNSRLLSHVSGPELTRTVQFILDEGAIVQRGIPMAQIDGQNFDLRVVCVYGKPAAIIFRLSSQPMTNLQLGGRRGDFDRCRAAIPIRNWLDALDHCSEAAGCFNSAICGVDLLFERSFRRHYVLEVNAFGDFFPGWVDGRGRSVHALEIEATAQLFERGLSPKSTEPRPSEIRAGQPHPM